MEDKDLPTLLLRIQQPSGTLKPTLLECLTDPTLLETGEDECVRVLRELEENMESFRGERISKTGVIATVIRILEGGDNILLSQSQKDTTFDSYLTEILLIQSTFDMMMLTKGRKVTYNQQWLKEYPDGILERSKSLTLQIVTPKMTEVLSVRNSLSPTCHGMSTLLTPPLELAMPDIASCEETYKLLQIYNQEITKSKFFIKIA